MWLFRGAVSGWAVVRSASAVLADVKLVCLSDSACALAQAHHYHPGQGGLLQEAALAFSAAVAAAAALAASAMARALPPWAALRAWARAARPLAPLQALELGPVLTALAQALARPVAPATAPWEVLAR